MTTLSRLLPITLTLTLLIAAQTIVAAQTPVRPGRAGSSGSSPDPNTPRVLDAHDSVFLEELTWLEVRDAMRAGKRTAIVATGGIEMNGPYLALGKHNYVLRATTEAIARQLGDALIAPIVPFVPEGDIEPATGHMRYPGIDQRDGGHVPAPPDRHRVVAPRARLRARRPDRRQRRQSGRHESGGRGAVREVGRPAGGGAAKTGAATRIHYIPEYYDLQGVTDWLESQGIKEKDEELHDEVAIEAVMASVDPTLIRAKQRIAKGKFSINGVTLAPLEKTVALGKRVAEFRAQKTVEAIRKARGR